MKQLSSEFSQRPSVRKQTFGILEQKYWNMNKAFGIRLRGLLRYFIFIFLLKQTQLHAWAWLLTKQHIKNYETYGSWHEFCDLWDL